MSDSDETEMMRMPELAWGQDGKRFTPPVDAVSWLVRRYKGGRPGNTWCGSGPIILDLHATMAELRQRVPEPGSYRLYPMDVEQNELSPAAHIEVVPAGDLESLGPEAARETHDDRVYNIAMRLLADRESHELVMANLLERVVTATATIQSSTAELLAVTNKTIRIANRVDAIERPPVQLDVDAIASHITEAMAESDEDEPKEHWVMQLLSGPIGMTAMQFVTGFAKSLSEAQKAKIAAHAAAQAAAQQQAAPPAPPPAAPQPSQPPQAPQAAPQPQSSQERPVEPAAAAMSIADDGSAGQEDIEDEGNPAAQDEDGGEDPGDPDDQEDIADDGSPDDQDEDPDDQEDIDDQEDPDPDDQEDIDDDQEDADPRHAPPDRGAIKAIDRAGKPPPSPMTPAQRSPQPGRRAKKRKKRRRRRR